jgi:UPF0755 protein
MKKPIILFVLLIISILTVVTVYREGVMPVNKNSKETKIVVIKPGQGLNEITKNLAMEGLIRNRIVFFIVLKQENAEKKIQAGDFRLSPSMDAFQIVKILQHGTLDTWITVVEGWRKEQVAEVVAKNFSNISEVEFNQLATEGYLFPDTYLIPIQATSESIIKIMKDNFNKKYTEALRQKARKLNLTDDQVVTLASLVEREAKYPKDRQMVASIILKRIKNDWPLQIDATVQYVLGYQSKEKTWWKNDLTQADLEISSLYNTRKYTGLPPGPICNPGLSSIEAVVNADPSTPYWYYVSDSSGYLHFAKTIEEHDANIKKYIQ